MRADRLLSLLLLLQSHEIMSASELAAELGVSVRTIYRDVDALCAAGIPIYADTGAAGGYRLVENYRTSLTGLTRDELDSLLLLSIPEPLAALDAGQTLKMALLKVYAAQWTPPDDRVRQRIYLDWAGWGQGHDTPPHLQTLYEAIWNDRQIIIRYRLANGVDIERLVDPYGLVAKAGEWYLVYSGGGRLHSCRVAELVDVRATDSPFERAADFDLEVYWKATCSEVERDRHTYTVSLRIAPPARPWLALYFSGHRWQTIGEDADGWLRLSVGFESLHAARTQILGLGGAAEVLEPEALRLSVADFAAQVLRRYSPASA
ncbi:MAG: WYL domain-containing protein [Chloroflexi bacterium]|nr:WYL domain-containing protein [Chloroflexota bacterium]